MDNIKYGVDGPKSRRAFEHNIFLLMEDSNRRIESKNDDQVRNFILATYPHVRKIRNFPNGRINFLTVNEQARSQANMQFWMPRMRL